MNTNPDRRTTPADVAYRRDGLWLAAMIHRVSGVGLAVFLPLHFLVLGLAIEGDTALDGFLGWTANPIVKVAEVVLIVLLTTHLLGGIRVMLIENFPWKDGQKSMAVAAVALALMVGLLYAISLF